MQDTVCGEGQYRYKKNNDGRNFQLLRVLSPILLKWDPHALFLYISCGVAEVVRYTK